MWTVVKRYWVLFVIAFLIVGSLLLEAIMFMPDLAPFPTRFSKLFWNQSFVCFVFFFVGFFGVVFLLLLLVSWGFFMNLHNSLVL